MGAIIEQSIWPKDIYRIQVTDPILGGQDGIINIQPTQIANRTRALKDEFELEHTEDGKHIVTDKMVAENAEIPESYLDLTFSTNSLYDEYRLASSALTKIQDKVETILGDQGLFINSLMQIVKLNWRYGEFGYEFEFFYDGLTMRDMRNIDSRRAIARDDSVDCEDNTGFEPGMRVLIFDEINSEEIDILRVLEDGRIRLVKDIKHTYDDTCTSVGYTNWNLEQTGYAVATHGKYYYSKMTSVLENSATGSLFICRDINGGELSVEYRDLGDMGEWQHAEIDTTLPYDGGSDRYYEHYTIHGRNVQLRITCTSPGQPVHVYHMALFPEPFVLFGSSIRTPELEVPPDGMEVWQDMLPMQSSKFLTAYRDYYVQTEYGLFDPATGELIHTISVRTNRLYLLTDETGMPDPGEYLMRARHQSDVSEWSAWSKPVRVNLKKARILFSTSEGEGGMFDPKAGGFDDAEMDFLGFYPVKFGFEGAKMSGGFDSVLFAIR